MSIRSLLILCATALVSVAVFAAPPATSCVACHASPDYFEGERLAIASRFLDDVHAAAGLSCHDCHGGNPDPAMSEDMSGAMDPSFKPSPYRGVPARATTPEMCGRCHSDLAFMRRFNPSARVDQVDEYWTSRHGQALRTGDEKVATCTDCHGVHGILRAADPRSPVYPLKVAETCSGCHADAKRMAGYTLPSGKPLPIDQFARWSRSVHAHAMTERGDLTAPTCNDCHGNHGARPPGVESVGFVCGQCHGREAELFRESPKQEGFAAHNEMIEGATCGDCHEALVNAQVPDHFTECATCHDHHGVVRPTVALLGPLPETPCAFCHEAGEDGVVPERPEVEKRYAETRDSLLAAAKGQGHEGDLRFDWLVDQALALPFHSIAGAEGEERRLRPEFARLFEKFRIGKTHYSYPDPVTGKPVQVPIVRCGDCHTDPAGTGRKVASGILARMRRLTALTARAERNLLAAQRGGVEVRQARASLDAAVDSQIQLEVLVHRFDTGGAFAEKEEEGMEAARAALVAGKESLDELSYRRSGLGIALAVIVLMLVALGLKIRSLG